MFILIRHVKYMACRLYLALQPFLSGPLNISCFPYVYIQILFDVENMLCTNRYADCNVAKLEDFFTQNVYKRFKILIFTTFYDRSFVLKYR